MYAQEPSMFYKTYPLEDFFQEEKKLEKEREVMRMYLPEGYARMQKKVEALCDKMEYEGSRMYDEQPDGHMIRRMAEKILEEFQAEKDSFWGTKEKEYQNDIVCCFLCNEMFWRRCRAWQAKKYTGQMR